MNMKSLFRKKTKVSEVDRITALEKRIFSEKKEEKKDFWGASMLNSILYYNYDWKPQTLEDRLEQQKKDFKELDHKFDLLERYLKIEYFKTDENTATYDWANKTSNEGFRAIKETYEEMKALKEKAKSTEDDE